MTVSAVEGDERPGRSDPAALALDSIVAGYGRTIVLRDVSLSVPRGAVVALLGPNGAGKTTLLRAASGLLTPARGSVVIDGRDATGLTPNRRAKAGLCLVPEGRGVFGELTVRENLRLQRPRWVANDHTDTVLKAFPILARRLDQRAGSMSGGEQQMLALARTYMAEPKLVLLDEVSMGLAPLVVDQIFKVLAELRRSGISLLVVEQYVERALELADSVVVLDRGQVAAAGPSGSFSHASLRDSYLGAGPDRRMDTTTTVAAVGDPARDRGGRRPEQRVPDGPTDRSAMES